MTPLQILFGGVLVLLLLLVAGATAWRQMQTLRDGLEEREEARHLRGRAWRRLVCSAVMLLLAIMLAVALTVLEEPAQRLADQVAERGPVAVEDPENVGFARLYGWFWLVFLVLLLVLLAVAVIDVWLVRRHGLQQMRRLQEDRRAMIESQSARLRHDRNGRRGGVHE